MALRGVAALVRNTGTHQPAGARTDQSAVATTDGLADVGAGYCTNSGTDHSAKLVCLCQWRKSCQTARQHQEA